MELHPSICFKWLLLLLCGCSSVQLESPAGAAISSTGVGSMVSSSGSVPGNSSLAASSSAGNEVLPRQCSVELEGGTGGEAGSMIPVCCSPRGEEQTLVQEVFRLLNEHRSQAGVSPLVWDTALAASMQGHVMHMAMHPFFSHNAPESAVAQHTTRARLCGSTATGENIARGASTARAVMDMWISSEGHNQNMLNTNYRRVGIGTHQRYWGQQFGR